MAYFSVVTIVRNDKAGLKNTYESVLSQTFTDFHWVVIDGASNDGTTEYLKSIQENFLNVLSEPDRGIYDAMNKGLNLAQGQYVVFMNAGDTFADNNTLSNVYGALNNSNADLLYGDSLEKFHGEELAYKKSRGHAWVYYGMFACHQSVYYSQNLIGSHRYNTTFKVAGDYDFTAMMVKSSKNIRYLNLPLSIFDLTGISLNNRALGRVENWKVQRVTLNMSLFSCFCIRVAYLTSSFLAQNTPLVYKILRFKTHES